MTIFSKTKNLVLIVGFVSSLVLNVATLASTAVATVMSGMFTAVTSIASVVGDMSREINVRDRNLKRVQVKLITANGKLKMVNGRRKTTANSVKKITGKITKRTVKAAARNAGSVTAEAIPYVGIAAMPGVTAMDLIDACDTMEDMRELNEAFDLDVSNDENTSVVCGYDVPKVETVLNGMKDGTEEAWKDAHDLVFELPDLSDAILSVQSGAEVAANGTTTAFYVTLDRAQDGAVKVVSGTGNIVDAMLKQLDDGTDYMALAAAKGFKKAMGYFDGQK